MQRAALGLIAIALLAVGLVTLGGANETVSGTSLRVGIVLALFWLAYPQLHRVPGWMLVVGGLGMLLVMYRPKLLWAVLPLAFVLWLLRPRGARSPRGSSPRD